MRKDLSDEDVLGHIEHLVAEEDKLGASQAEVPGSQKRLKDIGVALDRCWDLLRQRRALREFESDPAEAKVRTAETVEKYEQ